MDRLVALERGTRKETELHHKTKDNSKDKSKGGPGGRGSEPFAENLDDDDDHVKGECEQETIRDEDSNRTGGGENDVLNVERRQHGAAKEDQKEENELEDREADSFHGLALDMSLARAYGRLDSNKP
jgi:hypothetical protein